MTMIPLLLVVWMLTLTTSVSASSSHHHHHPKEEETNVKKLFDRWLKKYPKSSYVTPKADTIMSFVRSGGHNDNDNVNVNVDEYIKRYEIFKTNFHKIQKHNEAYKLGYTSYKMTIDNEFGDMTDDEFTSKYLMESQNCSATTTTTSSGKLRPPSKQKE